MKKRKKNIMLDALKAVRKANREQEIALYGKTLCYSNVSKNKKKYSRKTKHKNNRVS